MAASSVLSHWDVEDPICAPEDAYVACVEENSYIKAIGAFKPKDNGQLLFKSLWFSPLAEPEEKGEIIELIINSEKVSVDYPELKRQNAQVYLDTIYHLDEPEEDYDGVGA